MLSDILRQTLDAAPKRCVVGKWVLSQTPEDQELLTQVFKSPKVVMSDLYRRLADEIGVPYGITSFKSHMKGVCTCQQAS